jgi:hypothetical protein
MGEKEMKQIRLYFLFVVLLGRIYTIMAQEKDSIIYVFPDSVESMLNKYISEYHQCHFEFCLYTKEKDLYSLSVNEVGSNNSYNKWAKDTNRFILVGGDKYPLYFEEDMIFGSLGIEEYEERGYKARAVRRLWIIQEGYNITFDKNGGNITENYGLYIKK